LDTRFAGCGHAAEAAEPVFQLCERIGLEYELIAVPETMLGHARSRWPAQRFELRDVRDHPFPDYAFDYIIACGTFTVRFENSYDAQVHLVEGTLEALWPSSRFGIGFNVMSKHVDWERDDLFHLAAR
jgi:hypothetical protein